MLLVSSVAPKSAGVLASGLQYVLTCVVKHKCRALVSSVCVERPGSGQAFRSSVGAAWSAIYASRADQVKAELFWLCFSYRFDLTPGGLCALIRGRAHAARRQDASLPPLGRGGRDSPASIASNILILLHSTDVREQGFPRLQQPSGRL